MLVNASWSVHDCMSCTDAHPFICKQARAMLAHTHRICEMRRVTNHMLVRNHMQDHWQLLLSLLPAKSLLSLTATANAAANALPVFLTFVSTFTYKTLTLHFSLRPTNVRKDKGDHIRSTHPRYLESSQLLDSQQSLFSSVNT